MKDAVLVATVLLAPFLARFLCRRLGLMKPNFRGERIPSALGLTFMLIAAMHLALAEPYLARPLAVLLAFGLLGFIDDRWGNRSVGGFRGHLKSLFSGKPTTGGLKLIGGGMAALYFVWPLNPEALLGAGLIALGANSLNLLDLRPGRALFGFAVLLLPSLSIVTTLWPLLLGVLIEWPFDVRAKGMLGDTGSNLLGALVGVVAVWALPLWGQACLLALLLALNLVAERVSITATIEKTPWLRTLDRWLGVR